jgi:CRP-like cAMP-binding protein
MNRPKGRLLVRRLADAVELTPAECELLGALEANPVAIPRGSVMIPQGGDYERIGILLQGWALNTKDLPNGRRQVVDFLLPGAILGWQGVAFRTADSGVVALTDVVASWFQPAHLVELARSTSALGTAFNWLVLREHAIVVERLTSLGQRSARERLAHLLLELWRRLRSVGLFAEADIGFPISQAILAEATGLSAVHVNRSLQSLARDGLIRLRRQVVTVVNIEGLARVANYDDTYLHDGARLPAVLRPAGDSDIQI